MRCVLCLPTMDPECCDSKLKRLDLYLCRLPSSLAISESFSHYNFTQFSLDLDWVEAICSIQGAVNCKLEVQLGTHANDAVLGLFDSTHLMPLLPIQSIKLCKSSSLSELVPVITDSKGSSGLY
jgi:hypothetical protein